MRISSICVILVCSKNNLRHLLLPFLRGYNFALRLPSGEVVNTHLIKKEEGSKDWQRHSDCVQIFQEKRYQRKTNNQGTWGRKRKHV